MLNARLSWRFELGTIRLEDMDLYHCANHAAVCGAVLLFLWVPACLCISIYVYYHITPMDKTL